ncbi:MAG TPA: hypothetical protein VN841_24495 [Bryobacteraceae bacterium]|nr:hypothetical protein [Bryobacteraceae bacterium]
MKHLMKLGRVQTLLFSKAWAVALILNLSLNLSLVEAASPVIGTAITQGTFRVDNATVTGNATLEEGAVVETSLASSSLQLSNGTHVVLAAASRGRLFGDHMVLERGESRLDHGATYHLEALGLTIRPETGATSGRIALAGGGRVRVAALTGSFRVLNSRGMLVANLGTGSSLDFEPQTSSASGLSKVTGVLQKKNGHLLLTDETTNVTVEVAGPGLEKEAGNRVELTGSMDPTAIPVPEASQYIRVAQVRRLGKGAAVDHAGAAAAGAATAGGIAGWSAGTIAIIGGVAAAATVGGLAAANKLPGQAAAAPPVSR